MILKAISFEISMILVLLMTIAQGMGKNAMIQKL